MCIEFFYDVEKYLCDNFGRNLLTKRESWVIIINVDDTDNICCYGSVGRARPW